LSEDVKLMSFNLLQNIFQKNGEKSKSDTKTERLCEWVECQEKNKEDLRQGWSVFEE
jgi:hypothetical protein